MAEPRQYVFSYKEIAEALVKQEGIHEGLWGLYIEFGIGAANIATTPDSNDTTPAAIVPLQKLGIQRFDEASNLTVDAAEVNPRQEAHEERPGGE